MENKKLIKQFKIQEFQIVFHKNSGDFCFEFSQSLHQGF